MILLLEEKCMFSIGGMVVGIMDQLQDRDDGWNIERVSR